MRVESFSKLVLVLVVVVLVFAVFKTCKTSEPGFSRLKDFQDLFFEKSCESFNPGNQGSDNQKDWQNLFSVNLFFVRFGDFVVSLRDESIFKIWIMETAVRTQPFNAAQMFVLRSFASIKTEKDKDELTSMYLRGCLNFIFSFCLASL